MNRDFICIRETVGTLEVILDKFKVEIIITWTMNSSQMESIIFTALKTTQDIKSRENSNLSLSQPHHDILSRNSLLLLNYKFTRDLLMYNTNNIRSVGLEICEV